jgi:hypothetical protein
MSIGLKEKKKIEIDSTDKKEDKSSFPESINEPSSMSVPSNEEPDVFDSSQDNAMSEMKHAADMKSDNTSQVFSHAEEKQRLDPSKISVSEDNEKKIDFEKSIEINSGIRNSSTLANLTVDLTDSSKLPQDEITLEQDIKPETNHNHHNHMHKASELDHENDSVKFHDN